MPIVVVTRRLPEGSLAPLTDAGLTIVGPPDDDRPLLPDELAAAASEADGLLCLLTDRVDARVLEAGRGRLKVVANCAVGYDNVDVATAALLGVTVCNTPGVLDETTADLAFLLILAAARGSSAAEAQLREGRWHGWNINDFLGHDVHGRTLGIVGWGRIGRAVARRAHGFDMRVLHHARHPTADEGYVADLDELLACADVVTLHVPYSDETHHLVDARRLRLMQPTAVLVNTARGPVVDEAALAAALHAGELFGAGLDVFEREPEIDARLLTAPRTTLLPHVGSASHATRQAMGRLAATSIVEVLAGRSPANVVPPPR